MTRKVRWSTTPDEHDYVAAAAYLSLLTDAPISVAVADALRTAPVVKHRANDLLRAGVLPLLPRSDPEVAKDLAKVKKGERVSQVLLVRGQLHSNRPLTVADGYHRICASYHLDEDAPISCRIADIPGTAEASGVKTRSAPVRGSTRRSSSTQQPEPADPTTAASSLARGRPLHGGR